MFGNDSKMFWVQTFSLLANVLANVTVGGVSFVLQRDNDGESKDENEDTELNKRLYKQRQRAIASASGGRKTRTSRNTYKDKGRKSSNSSKMHKQMTSIW